MTEGTEPDRQRKWLRPIDPLVNASLPIRIDPRLELDDDTASRLPCDAKPLLTMVTVFVTSSYDNVLAAAWRGLGVDVALECTGRFTKRAEAAKHIEAGAKRVLVSAPADGADLTVVMGVNHDQLMPAHKVISNASCTTNCLAPVAYVLQRGVGIERGYMTTIHAYTGDQTTIDTLHHDLRRARAAALSMIPTSTGAAKAVGLVLPALAGKLDGTAIRVPTANVSLIDFTFDAARNTSRDEINGLMEEAADSSRLRGILGINKAPTVSVDFNHDPHSAVFDVTQTQILDQRFVRVLAWYDNEWGFSRRMLEVAALLGQLA